MPPNILFITSDQQRWDHVGVNGLKGVATPALDRIGSEGASFIRTYCPTPVCTPTRVSLLTGLMPSNHHSHTIGVSADPFPQPTLPERLKAAGYASALVGKSHFVERRLEEALLLSAIGTYSGDANWPFGGPYLGFDEVQLATGHNLNTVPQMHYRRFLEREAPDYAKWFPKMETGTYDGEQAGVWDIPEYFHNTAWVGRETERWLTKRLETPETPWFCWASFEDPHEPMVCPEPWFSNVDRDKLEPFESDREGEFDDKPPFYKEAIRGDWSRFDDPYLTPCVYPRRRLDEQAVTALQATLGMVAFIDDRVGRLIRLLEAAGQLENTVIVYCSDHGEMHGHHGFWGKGLTAFEDCQRVPLLIWAPGRNWRQGQTEAIVNLIDLPRFFLNIAGLANPQGVQGADLLAYLEGGAEPRRGTLIESHLTMKVYQQTYVNERYKLVVYEDEAWGELYDLQKDPDQYVNLWGQDDILQLRLLHEMIQQRMKDEGQARPRKSFG